jgi:sulfatase modifying factor 1
MQNGATYSMNNEHSPDSSSSDSKEKQQEQTAQSSACCAPSTGRGKSSPHGSVPLEQIESTQHANLLEQRPMISLAGSIFRMGTDYNRGFPADGEGPVRSVSLSPFEIDTYPVTNADFGAFVSATNYRTEAELFGWSFVFWAHISEDKFAAVVEDTVAGAPWWCKVPGATWNHPEGPGSGVESRQNHPVVHVSWHDAAAYAAWASKSLPTEAQWEYAARGGLEQKLYPWGDELTPEGKHLCNIWQGGFPVNDTAEDGYAGSCPVDSFPPNGNGLYSVTGNVWEWCADWFDNHFSTQLLQDPDGPSTGQAKVMKGGSFLCHASYCNRYRVAARTSNTPDSSASNVGFRCVRL